MKVFFAPDYRAGNPYQKMLAKALGAQDVEVSFPTGYRRLFPLTRGLSGRSEPILHLHWPEAYFPRFHDGQDALRLLRFPLDLHLATRRRALVWTAHNLWPHHRSRNPLLRLAHRALARRADVIIAHSEAAARLVAKTHRAPLAKFAVIPHGNLAEGLDVPPPLSNPADPHALVFGALDPYKGVEELILHWKTHRPPIPLRIIGRAWNGEAYENHLRSLAIGCDDLIDLRFERPSDEQLAAMLTCATVIIINHREALTSGAACLARSLGAKILLPARLDTVDLMEPHPSVFRFISVEADFDRALSKSINAPQSTTDTTWLADTSWVHVAGLHIDAYRKACRTSQDRSS